MRSSLIGAPKYKYKAILPRIPSFYLTPFVTHNTQLVDQRRVVVDIAILENQGVSKAFAVALLYKGNIIDKLTVTSIN